MNANTLSPTHIHKHSWFAAENQIKWNATDEVSLALTLFTYHGGVEMKIYAVARNGGISNTLLAAHLYLSIIGETIEFNYEYEFVFLLWFNINIRTFPHISVLFILFSQMPWRLFAIISI